MPNLLAMSFEGGFAPSFELHFMRPGARLPDGWGLGFYADDEPAATLLKEPAPRGPSVRTELVRSWEHAASNQFLLHVRTARWGSITHANTQPFQRSWGGRDWLIAHAGSLHTRIEPSPKARFQPVGSTDTEQVFCMLLDRLAEADLRSLMDVDVQQLHGWLAEINEQGPLTLMLTDGRDLVVYADRSGEGRVHLWELRPPYERVAFGDAEVSVDLTRRGVFSRKGIIVSSDRLAAVAGEGVTAPEWRDVAPGQLVVVRQGALVAEVSGEPPAGSTRSLVVRPTMARPSRAPVRRFQVRHRTEYTYDQLIERSTHLFRLEPAHDRLQRLVSNDLQISVSGQTRTYDDVFGNRVLRLHVENPYESMVIESTSVVDVLDTDPLDFRPLRSRTSIPLVWMPWQRHMLQPYLLPEELPESQLDELVEYAMSFVERNAYDLLDTLLDINHTLFHEYEYRQGSTSVQTTAFDVYTTRHGVCQDFTNLFIALARLLGVPARYVCGYVYTGPSNPNQVQSDASHAWVQLYLPEVGWKGFDPTNGLLTQTEHVRVAVGRQYGDATPTSGTIFVGGGRETLKVDVRVELQSEESDEG